MGGIFAADDLLLYQYFNPSAATQTLQFRTELTSLPVSAARAEGRIAVGEEHTVRLFSCSGHFAAKAMPRMPPTD
jgi:hypothetical protein